MTPKTYRRIIFAVLTVFASCILAQKIYSAHGSPDWLKLDPPLEVSKEGFRGVMWCSRARDIPWKFKSNIVHTDWTRQDEDFTVFGETATYITYTFRNTIMYGVRIDYKGADATRKAMTAALKEYPPAEGTISVNDRETRWQTKYTSAWVTLPEDQDGLGQLFLWGRDRKFPDDSPSPSYINPPPALNHTLKPYKPRHYVVYRKSAPIVIDGNITEKAWQDAPWTQEFEDAQSPYCPLPWKTTRAKIVYDDEAMYFAAQLQEENVWGHITKRDSISYYDNDFEIFVDPTANAVDYFEYEMTCLNQMFDMWHEVDNHRNALADGRYDAPNMRHAVKVQGTLNYHYDIDDGWTVEVMIPFADMQTHNPDMIVPPRRGNMWRFNFSRVQFMHVYNQLFPYLLPAPVEDWVWASTFGGDLHIPEMWAKGTFSDMIAGTVRDEELEQGYPILDPPKAPKKHKKGMVSFKASTITVGPDPTDPLHSPAHEVQVPAFKMDRYEVTVAEYCDWLNKGGNDDHWKERMQIPEFCGIVKDGPGSYHVWPGRENYPVVFVSRDDAMAYAEAHGKTLPTEEIWERAARGLDGRTYPWGNEPITPERSNYDFHYGGTLPVGSLPKGATPEGIFDLSGNVKELTNSQFYPYPGGGEYEHWFNFPFFAPPYPKKNWNWVNRGGAWTKQEGCMASAYRDSQGIQNVGFRCVIIED